MIKEARECPVCAERVNTTSHCGRATIRIKEYDEPWHPDSSYHHEEFEDVTYEEEETEED